MNNPLSQFQVTPLIPFSLFGVDFSLTNSSLSMLMAVFVICLSLFLLTQKRSVIPHSAQVLSEMIYAFIGKIIQDTIGTEGKKFIPFAMSLFLFIFVGNFLSLLPYSFGWTAHLSTIGALSLLGLIYSTILGLKKKGFSWFRSFLPEGVPFLIAPLIIPIEMISFLAKPFSLTIRLVMNMIVGHIMIGLLTGFIVILGIEGIIPLAFSGVLIVFEMGISFLQAYIYTVLSCIYLGESLENK